MLPVFIFGFRRNHCPFGWFIGGTVFNRRGKFIRRGPKFIRGPGRIKFRGPIIRRFGRKPVRGFTFRGKPVRKPVRFTRGFTFWRIGFRFRKPVRFPIRRKLARFTFRGFRRIGFRRFRVRGGFRGRGRKLGFFRVRVRGFGFRNASSFRGGCGLRRKLERDLYPIR